MKLPKNIILPLALCAVSDQMIASVPQSFGSSMMRRVAMSPVGPLSQNALPKGVRYLSIHPAIGIARLGDSLNDGKSYLEPTTIGGRPTDHCGNPVETYKDQTGSILRQAAKFQIFHDDGTEVKAEEIEFITWTVHLANKKAAWRNFNGLDGNTMLGSDNTYANKKVGWRNATVQGDDRRSLIIDAGPRSLEAKLSTQSDVTIDFTRWEKNGLPREGYETIFPPAPKVGDQINKLGDMTVKKDGTLLVRGGYGRSGGIEPIKSYGGADTWHDDISDGPITAKVKIKGKEEETLKAWVVVGSPKYAPELVNISTWADSVIDMAVRNKKFHTEKNKQVLGKFFEFIDDHNGQYILGEKGYMPSVKEDIMPIFERMKNYHWVANVGSMVAFSSHDPHKMTADQKKSWFSLLRKPFDINAPIGPKNPPELFKAHQNAFDADSGFPLMPTNAGDGAVYDDQPSMKHNIEKFVSLTPTQYYMLYQWANVDWAKVDQDKGHSIERRSALNGLFNKQDIASLGNCVGMPMSPGIEVTWSVRNPELYASGDAFRIEHATIDNRKGLTPSRDETEGGGVEPGDLTKRMAIPWQADFTECSVQPVNFTTSTNNRPLPTYYSYWWPPQAPWNVYAGSRTPLEQSTDGGASYGQQVMYHRGINGFKDMIASWRDLGFIVNETQGSNRRDYPNFVEKERNFSNFGFGRVAVSEKGEFVTDTKTKEVGVNDFGGLDTTPVFFRKK